MFYFFAKLLADAIFPIRCVGCKGFDRWVCGYCRQQIVINQSGQTFGHSQIAYLDRLLIATVPNQEIIESMIHCCKYRFVDFLAIELGYLAVDFLKSQTNQGLVSNFDVIVPVPLSTRRLAWRGFNQSAIIAKVISQAFGWDFNDYSLKKVHHTRPQVGLSAKDRKMNIRGAFRSDRVLAGKRILLIDDIVTTGSTLSCCAAELRRNGAKSVHCLVISVG